MPSNIFASVFDSLSTHRVHSSKDRHWREMAGFPHSRVAHKASEFYSLAMVNKNQWILGACALLFLQSVRQFTARQGLWELLKYWKLSLYHWYHKEFMTWVKCSAQWHYNLIQQHWHWDKVLLTQLSKWTKMDLWGKIFGGESFLRLIWN